MTNDEESLQSLRRETKSWRLGAAVEDDELRLEEDVADDGEAETS